MASFARRGWWLVAGGCACATPAPARARLGHALLEAFGGHEAHLADGLRQAERAGFAHIAAQDAGKRAGAARVALAVAQPAIAGDHDERAGDGGIHRAGRNHVQDYAATGAAVAREGFSSEAFSGCGPLQ